MQRSSREQPTTTDGRARPALRTSGRGACTGTLGGGDRRTSALGRYLGRYPERRATKRAARCRRGLLAWLALLVAVAGCGAPVDTPGEPLRLLARSLPPAFLGEPYRETIQAVGGLRPFTFTVSDGELPPGLRLEAGAIVGTPTTLGRYDFTITVSDASLNRTFQDFALEVVEAPPPSLSLQAPVTEIHRSVTLRAVVDGRDLRALRTRIAWDPERFQLVEGSVSHGERVAVFHEATPGVLAIDLAYLGASATGPTQPFSFTLAPVEDGALLDVRADTEFLAGGRHFFAETREGATSPDAGPAEDAGFGDEDDLDDEDDVDDEDGAEQQPPGEQGPEDDPGDGEPEDAR